MLAWKNWATVWELVNAKRPRSEWAAWGDEVRAAAKVFVLSWVRAVGARTKGVYLHMAMVHLGDFVSKYGDLNSYSTHGMEHAHKLRKQYGPLGTNFKPFQRGMTQLLHTLAVEHVARELDDTELEQDHAKDVATKRRYLAKKAAKYVAQDASEK